jgi:formate hydrogenlyase subunit 5
MAASTLTTPLPEDLTAHVELRGNGDGLAQEIECRPAALQALCGWMTQTAGYAFAGLVVEQDELWSVRYLFHSTDSSSSWTHVLVRAPLEDTRFPSVSEVIHAADWHEREAEDLFGVVFEGHPRLGDFVLHDDAWQEGLAPMRKDFDAGKAASRRGPNPDWRPRRIVHAPGAFGMPIGPVYSGISESAHFLLETVGEDVIRALPRFFYKYRAVEKIAEGRSAEDTLLLAERINGLTAFAHGLAFARALEAIRGVEIPSRAASLRVFLAELERLRHHTGAIAEICDSTALVVASSQAAALEEELLRLSGALTGHRYLFGLAACGGLTRDFPDAELAAVIVRARRIVTRLDALERRLVRTSSFLDRLEEVGIVTPTEALAYGLVGPIARASGLARDLRRVQPYGGYDEHAFDVPCETEGDGYARLRILFAEARQSMRLMAQALDSLADGPVRAADSILRPRAGGSALGWTEAPLGATFHWLRVDEHGRVVRYRIITPSFVNWHAFHLAAEAFAFQDFPIILASFGLSVSENDR